jgi:hypothetical protein
MILLAFYSFQNWKLRLAFEGGSDLINLCNHYFFQIPMLRVACVLNKFLPLAAVWAGASLKCISYAYVLNDVLYYFISAAVSFFVFKNRVAAFIIMMINFFLMKSNYFIIGQELLLTVPVIILFFALLNSKFNERTIMFFSTIFLIFIFWSHPVAILVFILLTTLIYILEQPSWGFKMRWWLTIAIVSILIRLNFLTDHDKEKVNFLFTESSFGAIENNFFGFIIQYTSEYFFVILLFVLIILSLIYEKKKFLLLYFALIILPVLMLLLALCYYSGMNVYQIDFSKFLFPAHFVIVYYGLVKLFLIKDNNRKFLNTGIALFFIIFIIKEYRYFSFQAAILDNHVKHIEMLILKCERKISSKFFVDAKTSEKSDLLTTRFHTESVFYSALEGADKAIQVVRADETLKSELLKLSEDSVYFSKEWHMSVNDFNKKYFNITSSAYKEVILASP